MFSYTLLYIVPLPGAKNSLSLLYSSLTERFSPTLCAIIQDMNGNSSRRLRGHCFVTNVANVAKGHLFANFIQQTTVYLQPICNLVMCPAPHLVAKPTLSGKEKSPSLLPARAWRLGAYELKKLTSLELKLVTDAEGVVLGSLVIIVVRLLITVVEVDHMLLRDFPFGTGGVAGLVDLP